MGCDRTIMLGERIVATARSTARGQGAEEDLIPRTTISRLVCTTSLMLLGFPAVSQESVRKGADTESGQLTFNNACRTCHTIKEVDNRLGPNLHNVIGMTLAPELRLFQRHERHGLCLGQGEARSLHCKTR